MASYRASLILALCLLAIFSSASATGGFDSGPTRSLSVSLQPSPPLPSQVALERWWAITGSLRAMATDVDATAGPAIGAGLLLPPLAQTHLLLGGTRTPLRTQTLLPEMVSPVPAPILVLLPTTTGTTTTVRYVVEFLISPLWLSGCWCVRVACWVTWAVRRWKVPRWFSAEGLWLR